MSAIRQSSPARAAACAVPGDAGAAPDRPDARKRTAHRGHARCRPGGARGPEASRAAAVRIQRQVRHRTPEPIIMRWLTRTNGVHRLAAEGASAPSADSTLLLPPAVLICSTTPTRRIASRRDRPSPIRTATCRNCETISAGFARLFAILLRFRNITAENCSAGGARADNACRARSRSSRLRARARRAGCNSRSCGHSWCGRSAGRSAFAPKPALSCAEWPFARARR